jgi:hypothetical protein
VAGEFDGNEVPGCRVQVRRLPEHRDGVVAPKCDKLVIDAEEATDDTLGANRGSSKDISSEMGPEGRVSLFRVMVSAGRGVLQSL